MEQARTDGGRRWKALLWRVAAIVGATLIVAVLGALAGWMLGSALTGAIFGAVIGLFGALRNGYVVFGEPNLDARVGAQLTYPGDDSGGGGDGS